VTDLKEHLEALAREDRKLVPQLAGKLRAEAWMDATTFDTKQLRFLPSRKLAVREGMLAAFHPTTYEQTGAHGLELAKQFQRAILIRKDADSKWIYFFFEDAFRENRAACWFDADWEQRVTPEGRIETVSVS